MKFGFVSSQGRGSMIWGAFGVLIAACSAGGAASGEDDAMQGDTADETLDDPTQATDEDAEEQNTADSSADPVSPEDSVSPEDAVSPGTSESETDDTVESSAGPPTGAPTQGEPGQSAASASIPPTDGTLPAGSGGSNGSDPGGAGSSGAGAGGAGVGVDEPATTGGAPAVSSEAPNPSDAPTHDPDIPVTFVGEGSSAGLSVTHSHLSVNESGLFEWLAVVSGEGPDPVCYVGLNAELLDASGNVLLTMLTNVKAPIYESFGGPSMCIGAGDQGVSYGVDFNTGFDPSQVAEIRYGISGNINPDAVPRDWVTLSEISVLEDGGSVQFTGTVSGAEETLTYPEVTIYPMNAAGMPLGEVGHNNPDDISAGGSWTFTTTYYNGAPFTDFYVFVEYDTEF